MIKNFLRVINELATRHELCVGDLVAYAGENKTYRGCSFVVQAEKRGSYREEKPSGTAHVKQVTDLHRRDSYAYEYPSALFDLVAKADEDIEAARIKRLERLSEESSKFSKAIAGFTSRMLSMDPSISVYEASLDQYIEFALDLIRI